MKDEIAEWKRTYANLQEESKTLYQEMLLAMHEREKEITSLQQQNRELLDYIECLEKNESLQNKGKDISEVKNKSRSLKTFLDRAQTALWFSNSFWTKYSRHSSEGAENWTDTSSGIREKYWFLLI